MTSGPGRSFLLWVPPLAFRVSPPSTLPAAIASGRAWTGTPNRPIISSGRDDRPQSTLPCCSSGPEPRLRQSGLASRQTHHLTNDCHALGDQTSHPAAASRRLVCRERSIVRGDEDRIMIRPPS